MIQKLIRHRRVKVVPLQFVLGAHEIFHLLLVFASVSGALRHQAQPDCPAEFVSTLFEKINFILSKGGHGNGLDSVRGSESSTEAQKKKVGERVRW